MRYYLLLLTLLGACTFNNANGDSIQLIEWKDLWADSDLVIVGTVVSSKVITINGKSPGLTSVIQVSNSSDGLDQRMITVTIHRAHNPVRVGQDGLFFLQESSKGQFLLTDERRGAFERIQVYCDSGPLGENWRAAFAIFKDGQGVTSIPEEFVLQSNDCRSPGRYRELLSSPKILKKHFH